MTRSPRSAIGLRSLVAVLVLAGGYLALAWFLGQHVPADTKVGGVQVGGQTPQDAKESLRRALADEAATPVTVQAGTARVALEPAKAGLRLDLDRSLDGLTGFNTDPRELWAHLTDRLSVPVRTSVDHRLLTTALAPLAAKVDTAARDGSISLAGGKVTLTRSLPGARLDLPGTADAVAAAWPTSGPVRATVQALAPKVTNDEIGRMTREFATKAVSGPVTVMAGGRVVVVPVASLAPAITVRPDPSGRLAPDFDKARILAVVRAAADRAGVEHPAKDATVTFRAGQPTVLPSVTGARLVDATVADAVIPALTSPGRTAAVKVVTVQPKLSTAQARKTLPKGLVSTFTTHFPDNPPRTNNIRIAVQALDGTYVAPGQQFSLNAVLGPRTAAKGYAKAPVINAGRLESDYGGGVSQVSTTTFNAAFFAGVRFDAYTPHSFYISRYPEGREATVSWPDVDQRWTNTTGGGILVKANVSGNAVTVSFYGTKAWDIQATKGPRRNVTQPAAVRDDSPACVPQAPSEGFDVTVQRVFTKGGATVRTETFTTHYLPEDDVTCTNPGAG